MLIKSNHLLEEPPLVVENRILKTDTKCNLHRGEPQARWFVSKFTRKEAYRTPFGSMYWVVPLNKSSFLFLENSIQLCSPSSISKSCEHISKIENLTGYCLDTFLNYPKKPMRRWFCGSATCSAIPSRSSLNFERKPAKYWSKWKKKKTGSTLTIHQKMNPKELDPVVVIVGMMDMYYPRRRGWKLPFLVSRRLGPFDARWSKTCKSTNSSSNNSIWKKKIEKQIHMAFECSKEVWFATLCIPVAPKWGHHLILWTIHCCGWHGDQFLKIKLEADPIKWMVQSNLVQPTSLIHLNHDVENNK